MPADVLFEIGCEEIPARMLDPRARRSAGAGRGPARRGAARAPRRPGARHAAPARRDRQAARRPPARSRTRRSSARRSVAAFAADGSLTRAGQGFAAKNGVAPDALSKREVAGKKGLYAVAMRSVAGQDARALLPELLVELAGAIAWPKSQRWGWSETAFVRPVQWLVALLGGEVVPVTWAGATSGRHSRGHRFLANRRVEIASPDGYADALRAAHVVVDPDARRDLVRAELARLERETGLRVRPDDELLAEVIHLGEYPVGVSGAFDPSFLEVPEELIVTEMRNHQRYFAMEQPDGRLANRFATMMATVVKDPAVVQRGNEYVIASRLSDAKFFFAEDRKRSFEQWNEKLASVVFQAKLGDRAKTIGAKLARIEAITAALAGRIACDRDVALRAAHACKADLASAVVGEFPELQGVMGKHYARLAGFPDGVAVAIEEHYFPRGQGGALPSTAEGALVALADRIDTLVGCFAAGLAPSGSADPFGLRRAAIGVLQILLDRGPGGARHAAGAGWPLGVDALIEIAGAAYGDTLPTAAAREPLREFFRDPAARPVDRRRARRAGRRRRARRVGRRPVRRADAGARGRRGAAGRARGVQADREHPRRRARQAAPDHRRGQARGVRLGRRCGGPAVERVLRRARIACRRRSTHHQYRDSFAVLAELGPDVAAFFDRGGVMVMDPDPVLRENRLSLLSRIYEPFARIADFRQLGGAS